MEQDKRPDTFTVRGDSEEDMQRRLEKEQADIAAEQKRRDAEEAARKKGE
jgi:hypothetical protein